MGIDIWKKLAYNWNCQSRDNQEQFASGSLSNYNSLNQKSKPAWVVS